jgi:hypothetical protein
MRHLGPSMPIPAIYPKRGGGGEAGGIADVCSLTRVNVLQPLPHGGRGCLPHHWSEVGRGQVTCLVDVLTLSEGGERERGPFTKGVSSELAQGLAAN